LVGQLRIDRRADAADWHAFLLLLGRAPEDLVAEGGIEKVWALARRPRFEIREINYAEVLRERAGADAAGWETLLASCLRGEPAGIDDRTMASLLKIAGDPGKFGDFLQRLQGDEGEAQ